MLNNEQDVVELTINGYVIDYVVSYSINYDIFSGVGNFTAEIDHGYFFDLTVERLPFTITINDIPMMKGWIDKISKSYSKNHLTQHVTGRDYMQLLTDNYVLYPNYFPSKKIKDSNLFEIYTKHAEKISIREIIITQLGLTKSDNSGNDTWVANVSLNKAQKNIGDANDSTINEDSNGVLSIGGAGVPSSLDLEIFYITFHSSTQEIIEGNRLKNFRTNHGQTLFEYMSHLISQLGCIMYNIPGTDNILILKLNNTPDKEDALCSFDENGDPFVGEDNSHYDFYNQFEGANNNIINCEFTEDITNFFNYIKILGTAQSDSDPSVAFFQPPPATDQNNQPINPLLKLERIEGSGYQGLTKMFTQELNSVDSEVWKSESETLINNALLQQYRRLFNIKYTVSGHTPDNSNSPYFFNRMCFINDDLLGITNGQFMSYAITYHGSKTEGKTTTIELCLPNINYHLISKIFQGLTHRNNAPLTTTGVSNE